MDIDDFLEIANGVLLLAILAIGGPALVIGMVAIIDMIAVSITGGSPIW